MHVLIHEDRVQNLIGVKLCVLSLIASTPVETIELLVPGAPVEFRDWCSRDARIRLDAHADVGASGYDVKPQLLLQALAKKPEVWWVDSDVLLVGDLLRRVATAPGSAVLATEEHYWGPGPGSAHRTEAWGLEVARQFPRTINTGILRVTLEHRELLQAWDAMLRDPVYQAAQSRPLHSRPLHLLGDQEVLTALLGSTRFGSVEVHLLRQGRDIAQCVSPSSYTLVDRTMALLRDRHRPVAIHAQGRKPWSAAPLRRSKSWRDRFDHLHSRLAPYAFAAAAYREALGGDEDVEWMRRTSARCATFLAELPLVLLDDLARRSQRWLGISRYGRGGRA